MRQIPFVFPLGGRWQGHGYCLSQHCHQKSICQICFKDSPKAEQSCGASEELSSIPCSCRGSIPVLGCQSLAVASAASSSALPPAPAWLCFSLSRVSFVTLPFMWGWPFPHTFPLAFAVSCSCVWRESDSNVEHFAVARYSLQGHLQLLLLVPSRNVSLITHINIKGREGKLGGREGGFCYFFLTQFPSFTSIRFSETDELLHPFSLWYLLHNSIWIFKKSCLAQPSLPSLSAWVPYFYSLFLGNCIQTLSLFFVC